MRKNIGYIYIMREREWGREKCKSALSSRCSLLKSTKKIFFGVKLGPWNETKKDFDKCWNEIRVFLIIKQLKDKIKESIIPEEFHLVGKIHQNSY